VSDTSTLLGDSSTDNPDFGNFQGILQPIDAEICKLKKQEHLLDEILNSIVDLDNYLMKVTLLYIERE